MKRVRIIRTANAVVILMFVEVCVALDLFGCIMWLVNAVNGVHFLSRVGLFDGVSDGRSELRTVLHM